MAYKSLGLQNGTIKEQALLEIAETNENVSFY
jgi:hypothetical protein